MSAAPAAADDVPVGAAVQLLLLIVRPEVTFAVTLGGPWSGLGQDEEPWLGAQQK